MSERTHFFDTDDPDWNPDTDPTCPSMGDDEDRALAIGDDFSSEHPLLPYWRLRFIDNGLVEGYPLCCVLFFSFVWWRARFRAEGRLARLLTWWATPNSYGCILCPWHRLVVAVRSLLGSSRLWLQGDKTGGEGEPHERQRSR